MEKIIFIILCAFIMLSCSSDYDKKKNETDKKAFNEAFVEISAKNPAYFQLSTGETYIPIGLNICWSDTGMDDFERFFRRLSENGGNFARVWIGHKMFNYETVYGQVDQNRIEQVDRIFKMADRYGIKVKLCIDQFRTIEPQVIRDIDKEYFEKNAGRLTNTLDNYRELMVNSVYHVDNGGPFTSMRDYMSDERGKKVFLDKVRFYKNRYGDDPRVFAWEIWNEMNAISISNTNRILVPWNREVLSEMKNIFPKNLVTQSLGSMDGTWCFPIYDSIMNMAENDLIQVHRYLDEGAELEICHAPMDIVAADAIYTMQTYNQNKPILLAETGGVKRSHTGPHIAYAADKDGVMFHDVLFAPFFVGAAGPGHIWHWDAYVDMNDVWFQIQRFANAIQGVDPVAEGFEPCRADQTGLKVYVLKGKKISLVWVRDAENTWQNELIDGHAPKLLSNISINLSDALSGKKMKSAAIYDPWSDEWSDKSISGREFVLSDFTRSLVIKIKH